MAKFTKQIVKPGKYVVNVPTKQPDGSIKMVRKEQELTPQRLKHWADTFGKMKEKGLLAPAPFYHDLSALPLTEAERAALHAEQSKEENRTKNNAGYWTDLRIAADGSLEGDIEVEVPEYAERMGKAYKECSLLAIPKFVSGAGDSFEDAPVHIAVVTNPIVTAMDNFKPIESTEDALAVAMSMSVTEEVKDALLVAPLVKSDGTALSLGDLLSVLPQIGVTLPNDTTEANFLDRLNTAVTALVASKQSTPGTPGNGLTIVPGGLQMSHKIEADSPQGKFIAKQQREKLTARIQALVDSGRIPADYVKDELMPLVSGCALSLQIDDEGNLGPTSLDPVLNLLERLPATLAANGKKIAEGKDKTKIGALALSIGEESEAQEVISEEQAQEVADKILANVGRKPAKQSA